MPANPPPDGHLAPADAALASALSSDAPGELDLDGLAERTGASRTLLEAMVREGLLVADRGRFGEEDVQAVGAGLALLGAGVPLSELLELARRHDAAVQTTAAGAVDLFLRYVRDAIRGTADNEEEASERLVAAFEIMLPATDALVGHHFRRRLLAAAQERLAAEAGS